MVIRFLLIFILFNFSVACSEKNTVSVAPENIRNSVWRLRIPYKEDIRRVKQGTGSFVTKPHYFLTNLHILYSEENHPLDYDVNNPHFTLIKEGEPERRLRIKKVLAISASYDLALLETEPSSDYLTIKEDSPAKKHPDISFWVLGYSGSKLSLKERKHIGNIFHEEDAFFLTFNNPVGPGFSGSPVTNEKKELMGVIDQKIEGNMSHAMSVSAVKKFINGDIGLDCNPFPRILDCIKQEIKNLHKRAEEEHHAPSQYNLAVMYNKGEGTERNIDMAKYWLTQAAEQKLSTAQFRLAVMEYQEENVEEAFRLLSIAARLGHAPSQYALSIMYRKGEGTKRNMVMSDYWLNKALEQGYSPPK